MRNNILLLTCLAATSACANDLDYTPLSFSVTGDRIVASGEIDAASLEAFEEIIEKHPEIRTLVLQHIGGSVDDEANVEFSRVINDIGMTAIVPSDGLVASGGADLFLAGTRRVIESGACIGVHSWAAEDFTATDIPHTSTEHDRYLDYYDDIDIDPAFYWFTIEAAPADGMYWMTAEDVVKYGVSTMPAGAFSTTAACDER